MKTRLLALFALFVFFNQLNASHIIGGEITWKCLGTGQFEFTLKIYRDCNGIVYQPYSSINVYGHPTVCSIPLNPALNVLNDLSPPQCPNTCVTAGAGTVQEIIQTSFPITLPGVPPATGWVFEVNGCCRNMANNLGGGAQTFSYRSVMYAYNGMSTGTCFDSSPHFTMRPEFITCNGYPFTYNPAAVDAERDSLVYSWAVCNEQPSNPPCSSYNAPTIAFSPPYSTFSPLPGNPTFNSKTGEMNFYVAAGTATTGIFATCIKVTAYKCGIKVAEVFRDCEITLIAGCTVQGVPPSNINLPPVVTPPFNGLFADTVVAGDTVLFNLFATEFQANIGGAAQTITTNAAGEFFGTGFISDSTGCPFPPCATLSPVPPHTLPMASQTHFEWTPGCALLNNVLNCTSQPFDTYYFIIKSTDNFCPAPASLYSTISITVIAPSIQHLLDSMWVSYPNGTSYQWYMNGVLITGATNSYYVSNVPGYYTCQIGTSTGCLFYSQPLNPVLSLADFDVIHSFDVVPNPAKENFSIKINAAAFQDGELSFTDVIGRIVFSQPIQLISGKNNFDFDASKFAKGFYNVQLTTGENVLVKKLVIE